MTAGKGALTRQTEILIALSSPGPQPAAMPQPPSPAGQPTLLARASWWHGPWPLVPIAPVAARVPGRAAE